MTTLIQRFLSSRLRPEDTRLNLTVFFFSIIVALSSNVTVLFGSEHYPPVSTAIIWAAIVSPIVALIMFLCGRLRLSRAFTFTDSMLFLATSSQMIYFSFYSTDSSTSVDVTGILLLFTATLLAVASSAHRLSATLSALTLVVSAACTIRTGSYIALSGVPGLIFATVAILIANELLHKKIITLQDNTKRHPARTQQYDIPDIDRGTLATLARITSPDPLSAQQVENLIEHMSADMRSTLLARIKNYTKNKHDQYELLRQYLPQLTPSELEICALIIQDKRQTEICRTLRKTPGNITCQRTSIRAKLNLEKGDNLRLALLEIVKHHSQNLSRPKPE